MTRSKKWILCPYHSERKCGFEICMIKNGANFQCSGIEDYEEALDKKALARCKPCSCGGRAQWGSGFLFCDKCGWESCYNEEHGEAVRDWNKHVKGGG